MNDRTVSGLSLLTTGIFVIGYMLGRHGAEPQQANSLTAASKSDTERVNDAPEASSSTPGTAVDDTASTKVRWADMLKSSTTTESPDVRTNAWVDDKAATGGEEGNGGHGEVDVEEQNLPEDKGKQRAVEVDGDDCEATATGVSSTPKPRSLRLRIPGSDVVTTGESARS